MTTPKVAITFMGGVLDPRITFSRATAAITAATTAPAAVQILPTFTSALGPRNQFRVVNAGTEIAFLGTGPTATLAVANAAPVTTTGNGIPCCPVR